MGEDKPFEDKSYPLDVLKRLLDTAQLLPHENPKEFHQLFDSLEVYGKAQTARDYMAVYQATVLTWDILRLHEMKIGVLHSHQRPALESLLRRTNAVAALKGAEPIMKVEADQKAAKWFADPATRPAMMKAFELAGYPPNAVQTADSGDCGQGFRLNATMHSDRRRPPVPTKAAGVWLPA